jgi:hypothetical protein
MFEIKLQQIVLKFNTVDTILSYLAYYGRKIIMERQMQTCVKPLFGQLLSNNLCQINCIGTYASFILLI